MKNKIILCLSVILMLLVFTTACSKNNYKVVKCTRDVDSQEGLDADMNYYLYYEGKYIKKMTSTERITFNDEKTLKVYKDAYKKSYAPYDDIKYYNHTIKQEGKTLISKVEINYDKVDIDKIIEIEGEDDNIYKKGKVPLKKAINFYKKAGIRCDYES